MTLTKATDTCEHTAKMSRTIKLQLMVGNRQGLLALRVMSNISEQTGAQAALFGGLSNNN